MRGMSYLVDGFAKPVIVIMMLLVGASVLASDRSDGRQGLNGFACQGFSNNPAFNRLWCQYHPARIWNLPLSEIFPGLKPV